MAVTTEGAGLFTSPSVIYISRAAARVAIGAVQQEWSLP